MNHRRSLSAHDRRVGWGRLLLFLWVWSVSLAFGEGEASGLVEVEAGDLPIILSAPHGGMEGIVGVPNREGKGVAKFNPRVDAFTALLARQLADAMEKELGARPYLVVAKFHRRFIDANRVPELAYESEKAKPVYEEYHAALETAQERVVKRWGRGLLIDLHGQGSTADAVFRGTRNGKTMAQLVAMFGDECLAGKTSLFGRIAAEGIKVIPAMDSGKKETKFTGGHIVGTYGSGSGGKLDAIQLELGRELRLPDNQAETNAQLSRAIAGFSKQYLPAEELAPVDPKPVCFGVDQDVRAALMCQVNESVAPGAIPQAENE